MEKKETHQIFGWKQCLIWSYGTSWCLFQPYFTWTTRKLTMWHVITGKIQVSLLSDVFLTNLHSSRELFTFNLYYSLGKFSRWQIDIIFLFFFKMSCKLSVEETVCMKCQVPFSGKNKKKHFKMVSVENFTQSVSLKSAIQNCSRWHVIIFWFSEKITHDIKCELPP